MQQQEEETREEHQPEETGEEHQQQLPPSVLQRTAHTHLRFPSDWEEDGGEAVWGQRGTALVHRRFD